MPSSQNHLHYKRFPDRTAPVVAVVGCDGSGKSTICQALLKDMRQNSAREVVLCHLGKQAGNVGRSLFRIPFIGKFIEKKTEKEKKLQSHDKKVTVIASIAVLLFILRRTYRFIKMHHFNKEGKAIITDRFPQNAVAGPMDGPFFPTVRLNTLPLHMLNNIEQYFFKKMTDFRPDLVIRLNVDLTTAIKRKNDHDPFRLAAKIHDVPKLKFNGAPILDIDTRQPLSETLPKIEEEVQKIFNLYQDGKIISLVGCDGAGKSRLSRDLIKLISTEEHPACYGYLGLGIGDLGRRIERLPVIGRYLKKKIDKKAKITQTKGEKIPGFMTALVIFIFSLIRLKRFRRVQQAVKQGKIVITDRYPQAEIPGICDGPGLSIAHSYNPFIMMMAFLERRIYHFMAAHKPDLVIHIDIDPYTAKERKPDHDIEALKLKSSLMPQLTFNNARRYHVDGRQPYEKVKNTILSYLKDNKIIPSS